MQSLFSLKGKNVLVSGASSGIGRQCAIDFSFNGANVFLLGRNVEELKKTKELCAQDVNVKYFSVDFGALDMLPKEISSISEEIGTVHGFLHAAGIEKSLPYAHLKTEDYQRIYDVNFISAMEIIKVISNKKYRGDKAKYVLVSSITSVIGRPTVTAYAASKGAMVSAVKSLSLELAKKGVCINCISPGTILTPMMVKVMDSLTEEQRTARKDSFPLGLGEPSDVSNAAVFLLSDAARWITGQNIIIDGGYTAH